jgi:hypothetical protein
MSIKTFSIFFSTLICLPSFLRSQSLQLGENITYRKQQQLINSLDSNNSYCINFSSVYLSDKKVRNTAKARLLGIEPISLSITQQYQSHHPFSINDEAMIPAKGYQTLITSGVKLQIAKSISLQLQPQFVMAQNHLMKVF